MYESVQSVDSVCGWSVQGVSHINSQSVRSVLQIFSQSGGHTQAYFPFFLEDSTKNVLLCIKRLSVCPACQFSLALSLEQETWGLWPTVTEVQSGQSSITNLTSRFIRNLTGNFRNEVLLWIKSFVDLGPWPSHVFDRTADCSVVHTSQSSQFVFRVYLLHTNKQIIVCFIAYLLAATCWFLFSQFSQKWFK